MAKCWRQRKTGKSGRMSTTNARVGGGGVGDWGRGGVVAGRASEKEQHPHGELDLAGESHSCKKLRKGQENLMPVIG